jgi:hypothetical protein
MPTRPYLMPIPRSRRLSRTLQERRLDPSIRPCMTQYPTHHLGRTCRLQERHPGQSIRHLCPSATRPHGPNLLIRRLHDPAPNPPPMRDPRSVSNRAGSTILRIFSTGLHGLVEAPGGVGGR